MKTIPSQSPGKVKGYCMLTMSDHESYRVVLSYQIHRLFGRSILCVPHQSGNQLMRHNRMTNKRRVIVASVPREWSISHLKIALQLACGPVEVVYQEKISVQEYWRMHDFAELVNSLRQQGRHPDMLQRITDPNHKIYSAIIERKQTAVTWIRNKLVNVSSDVTLCIFECLEKTARRRNPGRSQVQQTEIWDSFLVNPSFETRQGQKELERRVGQVIYYKPTQRRYHSLCTDVRDLRDAEPSQQGRVSHPKEREVTESSDENIRVNICIKQ